jgi:hypothetical protein
MRRLGPVCLAVLVIASIVVAHPAVAPAGEPDVGRARLLIMVEAPGCPYCARFHREIGPAYPNTAEGRFAPLVRWPMGHPDVGRLTPPVRYSPTFILMLEGREVGRITGYPGPDFFWPMLDELLARAGFKPSG